ncbi:MAG TPA: sigma-70 family RNA polymerase sigma factor [Gaiellaceae bacterium]
MRRKGATVAQLEALYRERYEHFVRVAAGIVGNPDRGRDAVQSAFAEAVRTRTSFRASGPLEAWLWRMIVNEARRLRREPYTLELDDGAPASTRTHALDELGLRDWIATLPGRQRAALFLRYYADLDYRAIAELLGIEVGTVSATLSAAHTNLRQALKEVER